MLRRTVAGLLAAAAALAPAASAATGVRVTINDRVTRFLSSEALQAAPDVADDTLVTVRRARGNERVTTNGGVSAAELVRLTTKLPPNHVRALTVVDPGGGDGVRLTSSEITAGFLNDRQGSPRFATFHADSGRIDFFRPVRDDDDVNYFDSFSTSTGDALEVALTTDNTTPRDVTARADETTLDPGESTGFSARLEDPPDDVSFTYDWDFGDGTHAQGVTPSHAFGAGHYRVRVSVVGDDGSAGVSDPIDVQVGKPGEATPGPTPSAAPTATGPAGDGRGPPSPGANGDGDVTPGGGEGNPQQTASGRKRPQRKPARPGARPSATPAETASAAPTPAPAGTAAPTAAPSADASATPSPSRSPGTRRRRTPKPAPPSTSPGESIDGILLASAGEPGSIDELLRQAAAQPAAQVPTARRGGGGGSVLGWVGGGTLLVLLLAGGAAAELRGLRT